MYDLNFTNCWLSMKAASMKKVFPKIYSIVISCGGKIVNDRQSETLQDAEYCFEDLHYWLLAVVLY